MDEEIRKKLVALIPRLRRQARFMVGDPELADDLVQEALTRGISKIHTWQPGTNLDAWMITVLRNVIITQWRQLRRRQLVELEEDRMWIPAGQESRLALGELRRALQQLTPGHKQILLLIAVEGLSYEEAADLLKLPLGTVRSRLSRARATLRGLLGGDTNIAAQAPVSFQRGSLSLGEDRAELSL